MNHDNSGPAFPSDRGAIPMTHGNGHHHGMTLRDYFAAKAMQGFAADHEAVWRDGANGMAASAYTWADAMLRARATPPQGERHERHPRHR